MKRGQMRYSRGYPSRQQTAQSRRYLRQRRHRFKKEKSWKQKIIFLWILFLILVLAYILFLSPIFKIKEIKVSGNQAISNEDIQNSLDNQSNLFLATGSKLRKILISDFPRILSIEVDKNIAKKTIDLEIVEREEMGIFCKEECYYIDKEGVIFEKAPQTSGTLILVIKDNSKGEVEIGRSVIDKEFITELIELRSYLPDQFGLKVLDFIIESDTSQDLKMNTNEGWYILFDKSRDFKNQVQALELVLEEKIKDQRENLEYVDLRIENRAYYK